MCKSKPVEDRKLNRQATALGCRPCFRNNPPTLLCATSYSDRVCADMNEGWTHWQTVLTMGEGLVYHGPILDWLDLLGWTSVVKVVTKRNTIKTFCAMWFPQLAKISADMRCTWEDFNLDTQKKPITESVLHDTWPSLGIHETYTRREKINLHFGTCATFCLELQPQRRPSVKFGRSWDVGMSGMLSTSIIIYFALGNTQNSVQTCPNCPLCHNWDSTRTWLIQFSILQADIFGLQYYCSTKKSALVLLLGF